MAMQQGMQEVQVEFFKLATLVRQNEQHGNENHGKSGRLETRNS